jgi:glycosyltransferase involved in cell wall biosynthesis
LRPSYERLAVSLGLQDRVRFVGRLNDVDVPLFYRSLDLCVFPSTSSAEAFGLVALEAQGCGIPVIASDLPGVRTVIQDGKTGLLVKPNDKRALAQAIDEILRDPDRRRLMGERARQNVLERFTWSKHMEGLMGVYESLNDRPDSFDSAAAPLRKE